MKVSYNWLKEFVDFTLSPEKLAHALTMAGLEVEAIEKEDDDTVIDIGVTPNRPDCLSIRGIAREIAAILEVPIKHGPIQIDREEGKGPVVEIESPNLCPRYCSRIITGVKPGPSPQWLSRRLESCGIRSTSNVVDVTNYILLELGQPMHAFDLDKLAGNKIVVKQAGSISTFTTLDNEERKLSTDMLLIWDAEKPVAIAGVMGGLNTEVSDSTLNILLESAYFNPSSVRKTSKSLNLSTEASYRFERGIDKEAVAFALDRAAQLIAQIAGGEITCASDAYPETYKNRKVSVSFDKINSIIGVDIEPDFVEKTLCSLGCKTERSEETLTVIPPSYRDDIERDIDIIEEVARIYGYDKIPSTLPTMQMSAAPLNKKRELIKNLRDSMVKSGYYEVINFSFMNPDSLDKLNISPNDERRNIIPVKNPLRKEDSVMRTTLIPSILNNITTNLNRGEKMLPLFEISNVFIKTESKLPDEITQMIAVYHKESDSRLWQNVHDGFYDLKGVLENIFSSLKIENVLFKKDSISAEPYLHPAKSCSIFSGKEKIGAIGMLYPSVAESFDIPGDLTIAEIYDINHLINTAASRQSFVSLPRFPYIERDVALIVSDDVTVMSVKEEILSVNSDLIESVHLFDVYKGKPIPKDKKSLAFSIRYRATERTLTDTEVESIHSEIRKRIQDNLKAELRS